MACNGCSDGCNDCGQLTCGEGVAGLNGLNAFTVTTGAFTQPAAMGSVTVPVSALGQMTGVWAQTGQVIFIEGGGYYLVTSSTPTEIIVVNLDLAGSAAPGAGIAMGAGVSPAGLVGPQGLPGTPGGAGTNGTSVLALRLSGTTVSSTSYTDIHSSITLPANLFQNVGDILRVKMATVSNYNPSTSAIQNFGTPSNHWRFDFRVMIGGVQLVFPVSMNALSGSSNGGLVENGFYAEFDIVNATTGASPDLFVMMRKFQKGWGLYDTTNGYAIFPTVNNVPGMSIGNGFPSGQTTTFDQSANFPFQIQARRQAIGSPTDTPFQYMPSLTLELLRNN